MISELLLLEFIFITIFGIIFALECYVILHILSVRGTIWRYKDKIDFLTLGCFFFTMISLQIISTSVYLTQRNNLL